MPPDGMGLLYEGLPVWFTSAKVPGAVVMKHHVAAQQNHRVARVGTSKRLADNYVTWLCVASSDRMKVIGRQVFQVKSFTTQPPASGTDEIRQVNPAKVISVAKKRVAVHHAMFEFSAKQMWYRAKLADTAVTGQPPRQPGNYLLPAIITG